MTTMARGRSSQIVAPIVSFALAIFTVTVAVAVSPTSDRSAHASTRAYADATIFARDPRSGVTVSVEADGVCVHATDRDGHVLWRVDALKAVGAPAVGAPVVRMVRIENGGAMVVMGKSRVASIAVDTGHVTFDGEN